MASNSQNDFMDQGVSTTHVSQFPSQPLTREDPEDFYRASTTASNLDMDADYHSTSPADSQAPMMGSWRTSVRHSIHQHPHQSASAEPHQSSQAQSLPAPLYFPPPPSSTYVNGEIGNVPSPHPPLLHIPPLSAGIKTAATVEEQRVAELEEKAQLQDRKDLAVKLKIRLSKVVLRGVSCICGLVVVSLIISTFSIFYSTRYLPARNNLPPWAVNTPQWPQITALVIAVVSLILSIYIMYGYWKGGHNRAERIAIYATYFTICSFAFTIIIWAISLGVMQGSRAHNDGKDIWGWSCKNNTRRQLFQDTINYVLVCRQNDWIVVCAIIEISIELLIIFIYIFAFYRLVYSKRKLRKSLHVRDKARSNLWLSKLQNQRDEELQSNDHAMGVNTSYNQLNANSSIIEAEEGRTIVPTLQSPPPPGSHHRRSMSNPIEALLPPPPSMPAVIAEPSSDAIPPTPRSVSFQEPLRPTSSSGSRER